MCNIGAVNKLRETRIKVRVVTKLILMLKNVMISKISISYAEYYSL